MIRETIAPQEHDLERSVQLRRALHRAPELSEKELRTAATIAEAMRSAGASEVLTGVGGHGVVAIFDGPKPGPAVMLRAELDALPIREETGVAHCSEVPGRAHLCGHDGHMAILHAVAMMLGRNRPQSGRAILLFQPAEENGEGARAMLADPRVPALAPDWIFALHNLPGLSFGHVSLAEGQFACASGGMRVAFQGRAAHASSPETGISPRAALARLMEALPALGSEARFPDPDFALVTIARVAMGAQAFGVSPGEGEIWATLRTLSDETMARLVSRAETLARLEAEAGGLGCTISYHEVFQSCRNDPEAVVRLRAAFDDLGVPHGPEGQPWRPSEDFGLFGALAPSAMFFLGSGIEQPPLHDPAFDFPDDLIAVGARIFLRVLERELGLD
ncbi:amidohydrolase [Amaricoccus macauensis]|uniref:amidohydrolase n=1 Tax=Amaricoccus macauensis TaxID=57001 RepID=UPI003C79767E